MSDTKRPRRRRRIAIRIAAALLVMLGLALLVLHSGWAKEKLRVRAEARLAKRVHGSVSIASLDYGFLFSDLRVADIEICDSHGALVVQVASLNLQVDRWASLFEGPSIALLQAQQVQVSASIDAQGDNNLRGLFRRGEGGAAPLNLRAIEIDSLGFVVTNARGNKVSLSDLQLRASVRRDEVSLLVLDSLETDVFVQLGERQSIAGHLSQKGATLQLEGDELELQFEPLRTKLEWRRDGFPAQKAEVLLGQSRLSLSPGRVVAELVDAVIGPLGVGKASFDMTTKQGLLVGAQRAVLSDIQVDPEMLGALLGRDLQVGRASGALQIEGQAEALVVTGSFETPEGHLDIVGTVDATGPQAPVYSIETTTNIRLDKIGALPPTAVVLHSLLPTLFRLDLKGRGFPQLDGRVDLSLEALSNDEGATATLHAHMENQSLRLDSFKLNLLGAELEAGGQMNTRGFGVGAQVTLRGNAKQALARLEELGLQIPRGLRLPSALDLSLALRGNFDDRIVVTLAPSETAIAGGRVLVVGQAEFAAAPEGMEFVSARGTMTLRALRLSRVGRLARRKLPLEGLLSGTLELEQEGERRKIAHRLQIKMPEQAISVELDGAIVDHRWTGSLRAVDASGGPELAWLRGSLPLQEGLKLRPWGKMNVSAGVAGASLSEHVHRLPPEVQASLASLVQDLEGDLRLDLGGSLEQPVGQLAVTARLRPQALPGLLLALTMDVDVGSDGQGGVRLQPKARLALAGESRPWIVVGGHAQLLADQTLPIRERVVLQLHMNVLKRSLSELASLSRASAARIRALPGEFEAELKVTNTLADPRLEMSAAVAGIPNLAGSQSQLVASASATRNGGAMDLSYGVDKPLRLVVNAKKQGTALRVQVETHADSIALAELAPKFLGELVPEILGLELARDAMVFSDLGLDASVELEGAKPLAIALRGGTRVELESLALPKTSRTYRNIKLELEGKGAVLEAALGMQESDSQEAARRLDVGATLSLQSAAGFGMFTADARIVAQRWLLFGGTLGNADAPRATLDADIAVSALLTGPWPVVDITAHSLAYSEPEREAYTHGFETFAPFGDVVFADQSSIPVGKLGPEGAITRVQEPDATPRRALLRLHLPTPIEVAKGPLHLALKGEVEMPIGYGDGPSGKIEVVAGTILLFRQIFTYQQGDISLGRYPMANLYFVGEMPPDVARKLSRKSAGHEVLVHLRPIGGGPIISFSGAGNEDMIETLSLLHTGQPFIRSAVDAPASRTVRAPQLMQPITIAFVKANIPRLDLFDRFGAWSDAQDTIASYGQLRNLDAEKRMGDGATRLRLIARPEQIGRSIGEAHIDRLFIDSESLGLGLGARAGSRLGGGVGLFFEWSSED